jgi:hypothetical protein
MSGEARYSQPIEPTPRDVGGPIVKVGFIGKGAHKRVGFIFLNQRGKVAQAEVTAETQAKQNPRGFFQSLARIVFGGPR